MLVGDTISAPVIAAYAANSLFKLPQSSGETCNGVGHADADDFRKCISV